MISICMTTFNGARFLGEQLDSVISRLGSADELVISDDGSTDDTLRILDGYHDGRMRIFRRGGSPSVVKNFEHALTQARGDKIFLCDQDDRWHPEKIAALSSELDHAALATCDCSFIDEAGRVIVDSFFRLRRAGPGLVRNWWKNGYMGCCMAFRRELLDKCLPFPRGVPLHDLWIGLVGEATGRPRFVGRCLVEYRCHGANISLTPTLSRLPFLRRIATRVCLGALLTIRLCRIRAGTG